MFRKGLFQSLSIVLGELLLALLKDMAVNVQCNLDRRVASSI